MTYLTASKDALAKALYVYAHREGRDERARAWELGTVPEVMKDQRREKADALIASGAVIDASTLANLLPDECWVLRSQRADLSCTSLVGGTFPNGAAWVEEMCCLPCRIAAALAERSQ